MRFRTYVYLKGTKKVLHQKFLQNVYKDDYGVDIYDNFVREVKYFVDRVLLPELNKSQDLEKLKDLFPFLLVGCDKFEIPTIDVIHNKYAEIETFCGKKIIFKCEDKIVNLTAEYIKSVCNQHTYIVLSDVIKDRNITQFLKSQKLKNTISYYSMLDNNDDYLEMLSNIKWLFIDMEAILNSNILTNLCFDFCLLYHKENFENDSIKCKISKETPYEFENHCAKMLIAQGFKANVTKKSGDQGVDVIAEKNGIKIAIQCKKYNQPVGNKAVQEINAGKVFYKTDYAAVVTNNTYTPSARKLAANCNVMLLHIDDLSKLNELV